MIFANDDIKNFNTKIKDKRIICFGAGGTLREFLNQFSDFNIVKKIDYILDNDQSKDGTTYIYKNIEICIISPKKLHEILRNNHVILISCQNAYDIYELLKKEVSTSHLCFYTEFIKYKTREREEKERSYPQDYRRCKEQVIPKIIHYCWFGGSKIPEKNRRWMESWKKKCPDYQIIEWNESNYNIHKCKFMEQAYKKKAWGFVPDYARLDILYHYGGIYLDTDVEIIRNPDELLYQQGFVGVESSKNIALGLGFGFQKEHKILKLLMQQYETTSFENNIAASPTFQKPIFQKLGFCDDGSLQYIDGITIYPEKVLSGMDNIVGEVSILEDTFFVHHYDGSWCNSEQKSRKEQMHKFYAEIKDA